jgi:hypothetical protein
MFRALLAHPQEALQRHWYTACALYQLAAPGWCSQLTLYAYNILSAVCVAPPEDEQVMLETCRGP